MPSDHVLRTTAITYERKDYGYCWGCAEAGRGINALIRHEVGHDAQGDKNISSSSYLRCTE